MHKFENVLALNINLLTTTEYFNILINNEEKTQNKGWKDRIKASQTLQKQHDLIEKVEKHTDSQSILHQYFLNLRKYNYFIKEKEKKKRNELKAKSRQ